VFTDIAAAPSSIGLNVDFPDDGRQGPSSGSGSPGWIPPEGAGFLYLTGTPLQPFTIRFGAQ